MACCLLVVALPAHAQDDAGVPTVHGEIIHDYARVTFEWPETVYFTANAHGKTLSITFDHRADPDFGALLSQLYPHVLHAVLKPDGKTVLLTLDKPYKIRTFVSDNINGIDLLNIDSTPKEASAATPPVQVASKEQEQADIHSHLIVPEELAKLAPAAGANPPSAITQLEEPAKSTPSPNALGAQENSPEPAAAASPPQQSAVAPPAAPVQATKADVNDSVALPPSETKPVQLPPGHLKVDLSAAEDNAVLRLPFNERVGLAVFARAHTLWVVINKPLTVDLSDFDPMPRTVVGKAELLPSQNSTILRLPLDDNVYVSVVREENSFNWGVLLTTKKRDVASPLKVQVNTDPPAPANVFIPALEMADSLTVNDPLVGDEFVVTPLFNPGEAIALPRDFVEFSLPLTAQGIVVEKKSDNVTVVQLRDGLRISMPSGASVTPGLPEPVLAKAQSSSLSVATLFPYDEWKPEDPDKVDQKMHQLFHKIVESSNPQDANDARLRMAQIYLSQGLAAEAIGHLDNINRTNPTFYKSAKLAAMHGAAEFIMYRFAVAAHDFNAVELNNNKEIDFWRSVLSDLLGNSDQTYDYLAMNDDYISKYPPIFRERLAIVAADRAIGDKEYNTALKIFDILHKDNILEPITPYVNFLLAKISADTGQEKQALEMWDKLAADYRHSFVRANAEYARIVWGLDHNTLTKDEAIDRLERLRLSWHGDNLELNVLMLLGELYDDKKDYVNAMRIWHDGVTSFANTSAAIEMSRKMQEAFIVMFNEGGADKMSPLDALALYYEYQNYTPSGTTGNEMIEHLADRLVTVDLLDQAAALLDHQMRFQTEKEQRSRLGTKLATIYLLNHQPQKALLALQDSMYGENALPLRLFRNRLTAQSLADVDQPDKAMAALGQDDSPDAEQIRLSIYWKQKDWQHIISSVEQMLKARKDITAPITLDESEYLLRLALAYVFENNTVQLQYLRDYFGPLMVNNPNKPVFDFITSSDVSLTTTNFDDVMKNLSDTRSFIDNYRARIKTSGLDAALKPQP